MYATSSAFLVLLHLIPLRMQCSVKGTLQGRLQILKSSLRNSLQPHDLSCGKQNSICSPLNVIPICHCHHQIYA